ncbi:MAG: phosphoadenylyl-sulfate reductase [Rhodospirillales bacterium]|nr:phosphoadenylyl-sulfate reductase [Rhodospirillales bacterium]
MSGEAGRAVAGSGASRQSPAIAALADRYAGSDPTELLTAMITDAFAGRIGLVSSFGAEAAVLLHMVSRIDPATPVIFLDTEKLFGETLRYRDQLVDRLGLRDVRSIKPLPAQVEAVDPDGVLWYGNPDMCCYVRKVEPMRRAVAGFDALITGRKRFHGGARETLSLFETDDDGRIKINPLVGWSKDDIDAYFDHHQLPKHPLEADGFLSIGCMPCTDRVRPGESARAGRWRDVEKSECGIHLSRAHWRFDGID